MRCRSTPREHAALSPRPAAPLHARHDSQASLASPPSGCSTEAAAVTLVASRELELRWGYVSSPPGHFELHWALPEEPSRPRGIRVSGSCRVVHPGDAAFIRVTVHGSY